MDSGTKQLYRFNLVPCPGPQCDSELYLLYKANSDEVNAYVTAAEHTHVKILTNSTKAPHGINKAIKPIVDDLLRLNLSIKDIRRNLAEQRENGNEAFEATRELSRKKSKLIL